MMVEVFFIQEEVLGQEINLKVKKKLTKMVGT